MSEWKEIKISDIADINTQSINKNFKFPTIEYIDTSSVEKGRLVNIQIISIEDIPSRAKRRIKKNDVLISSVRPNLEHYYFVKNCKENTVVSTGFVVVSPKKEIYPYYLYCLLTTEQYTQYLTQVANSHTSTYPSFNPDIIYNSSFVIPDYPEQKRIADVLSCLDAKIENLRKQNNTLEQIAQILFKHWFIDFEFPNTDGKPYKSSGGEMQSSVLGDIPKGWRVAKLGDFVNVINGYSYKGTDLGKSDVALINLKNFDRNGGFRLDGFKEIVNSNYQDKHLVKPNDLLVAHTDLTQNAEVLGNPILVQPLNKYSKYVISMDLVCIESKNKNINNFFLYYLLLNRIFKSHCIGYSNGTTVLHLSKKAVPEFLFAIPNDYKYISNFQTLAELNRKKITNNGNQIETLTKTRDALLPKLMSGQIRIEE